MSTYTIIPRPDQSGYDIAIIGTNGARQTMLGFGTMVEAEAWIAQDEWLSGSNAAAARPAQRHHGQEAVTSAMGAVSGHLGE
jgi:hypothetical protein